MGIALHSARGCQGGISLHPELLAHPDKYMT